MSIRCKHCDSRVPLWDEVQGCCRECHSEYEEPVPRCLDCGEETTHNRESSWYGHVHRFGPTDHNFRSDQCSTSTSTS